MFRSRALLTAGKRVDTNTVVGETSEQTLKNFNDLRAATEGAESTGQFLRAAAIGGASLGSAAVAGSYFTDGGISGNKGKEIGAAVVGAIAGGSRVSGARAALSIMGDAAQKNQDAFHRAAVDAKNIPDRHMGDFLAEHGDFGAWNSKLSKGYNDNVTPSAPVKKAATADMSTSSNDMELEPMYDVEDIVTEAVKKPAARVSGSREPQRPVATPSGGGGVIVGSSSKANMSTGGKTRSAAIVSSSLGPQRPAAIASGDAGVIVGSSSKANLSTSSIMASSGLNIGETMSPGGIILGAGKTVPTTSPGGIIIGSGKNVPTTSPGGIILGNGGGSQTPSSIAGSGGLILPGNMNPVKTPTSQIVAPPVSNPKQTPKAVDTPAESVAEVGPKQEAPVSKPVMAEPKPIVHPDPTPAHEKIVKKKKTGFMGPPKPPEEVKGIIEMGIENSGKKTARGKKRNHKTVQELNPSEYKGVRGRESMARRTDLLKKRKLKTPGQSTREFSEAEAPFGMAATNTGKTGKNSVNYRSLGKPDFPLAEDFISDKSISSARAVAGKDYVPGSGRVDMSSPESSGLTNSQYNDVNNWAQKNDELVLQRHIMMNSFGMSRKKIADVTADGIIQSELSGPALVHQRQLLDTIDKKKFKGTTEQIEQQYEAEFDASLAAEGYGPDSRIIPSDFNIMMETKEWPDHVRILTKAEKEEQAGRIATRKANEKKAKRV